MIAASRRAVLSTLIRESCWARPCASFRRVRRGNSGAGCSRSMSCTVPARSRTPMLIRPNHGGCGDAEPRAGGCRVSAPLPCGQGPNHVSGATPERTIPTDSTQRCAWCATSGVKASAAIPVAITADNGPNGQALLENSPPASLPCAGRLGWPVGGFARPADGPVVGHVPDTRWAVRFPEMPWRTGRCRWTRG